MSAHDLIGAEIKVLGKAKATISTATTTSFDFGTPDDLNLVALSNFKSADRIVVVFDASTAGTTDTVSWVVQDAPDSSGSIGTPATAITDGALTGGTGDQYAIVGVRLQSNRPWLRCRVTSSGATDTFIAQATVLAIPASL